MDYINKLAELLNVAEITEDWKGFPALEVSQWHTADGYEIHVVTNDAKQLDWENDVYYYEPQFDTIIERIEDTCHDLGYGSEVRIYIDAEAYLPEQEVIEWLEQKED